MSEIDDLTTPAPPSASGPPMTPPHLASSPVSPATEETESTAPTPATVDAPAPSPVGTRRRRRGIVLPLVAVVALLIGGGVAVAGLSARQVAEDEAADASTALPLETENRDQAKEASDTATARSTDAATREAAAVAEARRVHDGTDKAAGLAGQMVVCNQQMIDATNEQLAALSAEDFDRADRAVDTYNVAVDECNRLQLDYLSTVDGLYEAPATASA